MFNMINPAVLPIINSRGISSARLDNLIYIKEFIDRISSTEYIKADELERLEKKYGVKPDIITWGDYFQAEMATSLKDNDDMEFVRALETVKFDMISSYTIFKNKDAIFFEWIENSVRKISGSNPGNLTDEENELIHLKILMDYYQELGITGNFLDTEITWYSSFKQAMVV